MIWINDSLINVAHPNPVYQQYGDNSEVDREDFKSDCRGTPTTLGVAQAEDACNPEIGKTKSDWQSLSLQPASKPGVISKGVNGRAHIQPGGQGSDHEALLHLDIVRAYLNLPEIQHPTDHRYLLKS